MFITSFFKISTFQKHQDLWNDFTSHYCQFEDITAFTQYTVHYTVHTYTTGPDSLQYKWYMIRTINQKQNG